MNKVVEQANLTGNENGTEALTKLMQAMCDVRGPLKKRKAKKKWWVVKIEEARKDMK